MTAEQALQIKQMHRSEVYERSKERTDELHDKLPAVADIDARIAEFPTKLMHLPKGDGRAEALSALKAEVAALGLERKKLLLENGFSENYDAVEYECATCKDTGSVGGRLCTCVRRMMATELYNAGGIGKALMSKDFEGFSLDYYTGEDRQKMSAVLSVCRSFAADFDATGRNLLLLGGTGLGKTHLSAAIAKEVISRGYTAYYETAPALFDAYDAVRFGRKEPAVLSAYDCQLLVIDDLGSEANGTQNTSVLFEIINRRYLSGLSTVISTNLSPAEIKKRYNDRVYSRLLGEYDVLCFTGTDVRLQKLKEKK